MKNKILNTLKDADGFVSGEELSKILGVSRTAVWKHISKLKQEGYELESVTRKGYRLLHSPDLLTAEELAYGLNTEKIGQKILCFDEIDSTNLEVKRQALDDEKHGLVVVAEEQTKGRGRKGRQWVSPKGTGIWMSLMLKPDLSPSSAPMLTLVAGLAVCEAIQGQTGLEAQIKWPNDIVVQKKKICGILTEMNGEIDHLNYIVLGIGVNVNVEGFPKELEDIATSLKIASGKEVSRVQLLQKILERLEHYYRIFERDGDLQNLIEGYKSHCITYNKEVKVLGPLETMEGIVVDITDQGELILETEEGTKKVVSGEVSVRGMYGYV